MPDSLPTEKGSNRLRHLRTLLSWWPPRSFLISLGITLASLTLYYFTFSRNAIHIRLLRRIEYNALDTRFRYRPPSVTPIDPRIVSWTSTRNPKKSSAMALFAFQFCRNAGVLKDDGAAVVAFDVTFDKPTGLVIRFAPSGEFRSKKESGTVCHTKLESEVRELAVEFDADARFLSIH